MTASYSNVPFTKFSFLKCDNDRDECLIQKGRNATIASWGFNAYQSSRSLYVSVLIGWIDGRELVSQLEMGDIDLCQLPEFNGISHPLPNSNRRQCDISSTRTYQLPPHSFYVPRLLPKVSFVFYLDVLNVTTFSLLLF